MAPRSTELNHVLVERTCKTSTRDELMMMCGALRALPGSVYRWDMMAWHPQCDAKHHIDAYLMVKVWSSGRTALMSASSPACRCQDGRAMAQAGCQSCHLHRGRWPNTPGSSAKRPGALAQPHVQAPRCSYAGARHGQGSARQRTVRPQMALPSQDLLRPIANGPGPEVQTLIYGVATTAKTSVTQNVTIWLTQACNIPTVS